MTLPDINPFNQPRVPEMVQNDADQWVLRWIRPFESLLGAQSPVATEIPTPPWATHHAIPNPNVPGNILIAPIEPKQPNTETKES
jgi:hypothetical protein